MTVGNRMAKFESQSFRSLHVFGNHMVAKLVNMIFKSNLVDIMSGYRAFNKEFVKNIPVVSKGFEVETQMTLQALNSNFVIKEVPIQYGERPEGSYSKLNTFSDGMLVIINIFDIFKAYRPLLFFSFISLVLFFIGLLIGSIPVIEFMRTGKVLHFPSAILAAGIMIVTVISLTCGIILDTINHRLEELGKMIILSRNEHQSNTSTPTKLK